MKKKIVLAVLLIVIAAYALHYNFYVPSYEYTDTALPESFNEFYAQRLTQSAALHTRPGNEERLVRYASGKTPVAILYIHGYGASRAEGEYVLDKIASRLKANTYYLRLPGHGTNKDDHKNATPKDHLDTVITALRMMDKLGEKTIVVGTSMGGLLATYLAANYPEKMAGVVLVSPFYNFPGAITRLVNHYPVFRIFVALNPIRVSSHPVPPEEDNWTKYWYREQYFIAGKQLISLARMIARDEVFEKVSVPVLLLYNYKDETHQDDTASVPHMKYAFEHFGKPNTPHPLNRAVPIADGSHVLMSKYSKTDEKIVIAETLDFIRKVAGGAE